MLKKLLLSSLRQIRYHSFYSVINVTGLAIGMMCSMLVAIYAFHEFSYDTFHDNAERIYRVIEERRYTDNPRNFATSYVPVSFLLNDEFPELEIVRLSRYEGAITNQNGDSFFEHDFFYADSSFFDIFNFKILSGEKENPLNEPFTVYLTPKTAQKYFGDENPVGKTLFLDNNLPLQIVGLVAPAPENSHIRYDFIASFPTVLKILGHAAVSREAWWSPPVYTYVLFPEGFDIQTFKRNFPHFINRHIAEWMGEKRFFKLQPLTKIHLYSNLENELTPNGNISYVRTLIIIAIVLIIIVIINYINLSTALSFKRIKETALRKVSGGEKHELILQFLTEAVLISAIALILAAGCVEICLPWFEHYVERQLLFFREQSLKIIGWFLLITFSIGILSGLYPAFYLSRTPSISLLRAHFTFRKHRPRLRKILVIFQFAISSALISFMLLISEQMQFIRHKDPGFDKQQILILELSNKEVQQKAKRIKNELLEMNDIISATITAGIPGNPNHSEFPYKTPDYEYSGTYPNILTFSADYDFPDTYDIDIIKGRDFDEKLGYDSEKSFILNETAVETFGWEKPIGKEFTLMHYTGSGMEEKEGRIIGVVRDFHFKSLHHRIEPLVIQISPSNIFYNYISLKTDMNSTDAVMKEIHKIWQKLEIEQPPDISYLSDDIQKQYELESKLDLLVKILSVISVILACIGLFALSSFITLQSIKETGIRKTLGALRHEVLTGYITGFIKWILIATGISIPVSLLFMNLWLQSFAYKVTVSPWLFIYTLILVTFISVMTILYHGIKISRANPVETIRYE